MVEILSHLHQYVPIKQHTNLVHIPSKDLVVSLESATVQQLLIGGDQLSAARARGAIKAMSNGTTPQKRLDGFIPVVEDWHTQVVLLEVKLHTTIRVNTIISVCTGPFQIIWKYFFDTQSSKEHGTIYQLKNLLNRTNVTTVPKHNFNTCDDFIKLIITCFILAAAMKTLGMKELNDKPSSSLILERLKSADDRKVAMDEICDKVVANFICTDFNKAPQTSKDQVKQYSLNLLSIGSFYLEFTDAIREGDGDRVLRCWRYLLPIFNRSGRRNYCLEAFKMLYQYHYALPPRQTQQLIWGRFVNIHGTRGRNIPLDLHQEHLNRMVKSTIDGLGANKTGTGIVRCGKALGTLASVLSRFDNYHDVKKPSGAHPVSKQAKETVTVVKELLSSRVLEEVMPDQVPGEPPKVRHFPSFPKPMNILHAKPTQLTVKWITDHLRACS